MSTNSHPDVFGVKQKHYILHGSRLRSIHIGKKGLGYRVKVLGLMDSLFPFCNVVSVLR